ncbi:insulinase family protein [Patescibacteria group bacterium AH-259-L07]|nr:insulinase family protein [Patescibacteria group bacterium AH-259-L07]
MFYQSKLSNGIRLLTIPAKNTKAVTILVLLPVGSRHEAMPLLGASHFIEHMMFKGTVKRKNNLAIAKELDALGAHYNAFTAKDHTGYWIKTIREKTDVALDILSDMLFNSVFDKGEFEREKGVISEEIKMYKENPLLYIMDAFDTLLYKQHPLGKVISGSVSTVSRMNRTKLLAYKERFYTPSNMVVAICGDVKKSEVVKLIGKYFSSYCERSEQQGSAKHGSSKGVQKGVQKKYTPIPFKKQNVSLHQRVSILFKQVDQVQVALGGFAYPYQHRLREALALLLIILGGNMSSRLFSEVRVKRGLAYFVKADAGAYSDIGSYSIRAGVDKDKTREAVAVILDELKKVRKYGVSEEELKRAKDYFKGTIKLSLEDSANLVSWYANQVLLGKKILSPTEKLRKIQHVEKGDISKVARAVLKPQTMCLALIGPFKNKKPFLHLLQKSIQ